MGEVTEFNDEAKHVILIKAANGSTQECFRSKWMVWIRKECEALKFKGQLLSIWKLNVLYVRGIWALK
ncbi:hypothetical protein Hanom_Chr06g00534091 [Helianthus anomalus]